MKLVYGGRVFIDRVYGGRICIDRVYGGRILIVECIVKGFFY